MRLIDADELNMRFCENPEYSATMFKKIRRVVESTPTIEAEPVKHGRWIIEEDVGCDGEGECIMICSVCGRVVFHVVNPKKAIEYRPYCHCGAKMDLEETE